MPYTPYVTLDTLLAVIGLAVAAYQLMPRARQLDLAVRFHPFDWFLLAATGVGIIYLQFFSFFRAIGWTPKLGLSRWAMTPERASFVVLLIGLAVVTLRIRFSRLSRRVVPRLAALVEQLMWDRNAGEAAHVIERHLTRLRQLATGASWWTSVRRYAAPTLDDQRLEIYDLSHDLLVKPRPVSLRTRLQQRVRKFLSPIGRYLPSPTKRSEQAAWLLSRVQQSREFAVAVAQRNPYFALKLMAAPDHDVFAFMKLYFRVLLAESSSVLHREIRDHAGSGGGKPFSAGTSEPLLAFLFNDANAAERLHVYKPIGDAVLDELLELRRDPGSDPYNLSANDSFRDDERWETSLFSAICFFDLMVSAALHHRIRWHMWLMYFADFAEEMIENHIPREPNRQPDTFYETRYTYLLYQMMDRCRDWMLAISRIKDADNPNAEVVDDDGYDTIPKAATQCLRRILFSILTAQKLSASFRERMAHLVFDAYFSLRSANQHALAHVLARGIRAGNPYSPQRDQVYREELARAFDSFDKIPHITYAHRPGRADDPLSDLTTEVFGG